MNLGWLWVWRVISLWKPSMLPSRQETGENELTIESDLFLNPQRIIHERAMCGLMGNH